jgi:hypothetical protein
MRNMKIRVALGTLVAVAALIALRAGFPSGTLPKVHAQEEARATKVCSLETLEGRYSISFSGFGTSGAVPATINAFFPIAGVGLITFDGDGNLSDVGSTSRGGLVLPINVPGTYTVNSDCTGSLTTPHAHLNFVIVSNGREIRALNVDQGAVILDNFVKQ